MAIAEMESFRPKLRPGRVLPMGTEIIFETQDPYNQIVLPVVMADFVLLCSGKYTVREIVEKIYRKQAYVPFRTVRETLRVLRDRGFFENGEQLCLDQVNSVATTPHSRVWHKDLRLQAALKIAVTHPLLFFVGTLGLLTLAILGLKFFSLELIQDTEALLVKVGFWPSVLCLVLTNSIYLTIRNLVLAWQLLLLTGRVYNLNLRIAPWGCYLHVGAETQKLEPHRLNLLLLTSSQVLFIWALTYLISVSPASEFTLWFVALSWLVLCFELNPVRRSLPGHRIWMSVWVLGMIAILQHLAVAFGPVFLTELRQGPRAQLAAVAGFSIWVACVFYLARVLTHFVVIDLIGAVKELISSVGPRSWTQKDLSDHLKGLSLFSGFDEDQFYQVLALSQVQTLSIRSLLTAVAPEKKCLWILLEGAVSDGRETFLPVTILGESTLIDGVTPTLWTTKRSVVLTVPVEALRELVEGSASLPGLGQLYSSIVISQFFAASEAFRTVSQQSIDFLCSRGNFERYDKDQPILRRGSSDSCIYLVLKGSVWVQVTPQEKKKIPRGGFFGEIAVLAALPRTADVDAAEPALVFRVPAEALWEILIHNFNLGLYLEEICESRLQEDLRLRAS